MSIFNVTNSSVDIKWQAPTMDSGSTVVKYKIEYKQANTSEWIVAGYVDGITYTFSVTNIREGHEYYFRVTAINCKGPGSPLESVDLVKLIGRWHGINMTCISLRIGIL